jgi:murein DD-endopeptidase MepM/ murein hydrolase activator NlpD
VSLKEQVAVDSIKRFFQRQGPVLLRLALILCVAQLLFAAVPQSARRSTTPSQSGMGGGSKLDNVVSEASDLQGKSIAAAYIETPESLEAGILEPEAFSKPRLLFFNTYSIQKGDIIGNLAAEFGLNEDTLISANNIKNTRTIQIGQVLRVPNQDGVFYSVKKDDTLASIAEKYQTEPEAIRITNELFSETVRANTSLFIPGARLDWVERQEINGDLFIWPVSGYITSPYGYRKSPFTGIRQFHSGLDIGSPMGTPIRAAMSGRVSAVGWDDVLGNFAVVSHHSGYRTLYGHMSVIRVKAGAYIGTGERIGDVGSTGLSTGPHLHFTVYKNGITTNPRSLMK